MLKYVVCLCKGCDGCCVFVCIVTRGAVSARVWEVMGGPIYHYLAFQFFQWILRKLICASLEIGESHLVFEKIDCNVCLRIKHLIVNLVNAFFISLVPASQQLVMTFKCPPMQFFMFSQNTFFIAQLSFAMHFGEMPTILILSNLISGGPFCNK